MAKRYGVASSVVRACDADLGVRILQGSPVRPGSIVSYPYGFQSTAVKLYEAATCCAAAPKKSVS